MNIPKCPNKEVNALIRKAVKQGWRVEKGGTNHILFFPPDKESGFVTVSSTPRSSRNLKNTFNLLKAKGLKL